jgi:hypothetical protein
MRLLEIEFHDANPATPRHNRRQLVKKSYPPFEFEEFKLPPDPPDSPFPELRAVEGYEATDDQPLNMARPTDFAIALIPALEEPELDDEFAKYPIAKLATYLRGTREKPPRQS